MSNTEIVIVVSCFLVAALNLLVLWREHVRAKSFREFMDRDLADYKKEVRRKQ